ncbi:MAG: cytochrome c [Pseudomonadota bacterium]
MMRGKLKFLVIAVLVVAGIGATYFFSRFPNDVAVTYDNEADHFKYGSIGGDTDNGLPTRIMEVLPTVFADLLPAGTPQDWSAFGFIMEPGRGMPIGFSERTMRVPLSGMNCATCHTGIVRAAVDAEPRVFLGMGSTQLDLGEFFNFLFKVIEDPRYNAETLFPVMEARAPLNLMDRFVYKRVIKKFKEGLEVRKAALSELFDASRPPFGPGRVDTFNPYKLGTLGQHYPNGLTEEESIGTARYASIWNQSRKRDRPLNWDGNAPRVQDRNTGAAFGAGATPESMDLEAIDRIQQWLEVLPAPEWPFDPPNADEVARGEAIYRERCYACHDPEGSAMGKIVPVERIGTDRRRFDSYTEKLNTLFLEMGKGQPWALTDMQKTVGYANRPLDGLWARAPYLHNGSVPTMWDLLLPEDQRNGGETSFRVSHTVYDPVNMGMRTDLTEVEGRAMPEFDLTLPGNSNKGHTGRSYGTDLAVEDKWDLIAYLKTL